MEEKIKKYIEQEKSNKPLHIPGYNYCGPGTKVVTSITNNVKPINDLDEGCRVHDVEYLEFAGNPEKIIESDKRLINVSQKWRDSKKYKDQRRGFFSKIYDWFSSKGVEKVFQGKRLLEKYKILDPVGFAQKLSNRSFKEDVEIGKYLKSKYFNN